MSKDLLPSPPDNDRRDKMLSLVAASLVVIAEELDKMNKTRGVE
jgi:hypothetical protein